MFLDQVAARLEVGRAEYGDRSFRRPPLETDGEILDEILDIAGWAFVKWVQMSERLARVEAAAARRETPPQPPRQHPTPPPT